MSPSNRILPALDLKQKLSLLMNLSYVKANQLLGRVQPVWFIFDL